jgi:transcriptional regulator with XRE-family HTH domain
MMIPCLKRLREKAGMSQAALAAAAGLRGPASISDLENGKANPTLETLDALARALGHPVERLFVDEPLSGAALVQQIRTLYDGMDAQTQDTLVQEFLRIAAERLARTPGASEGPGTANEPAGRRTRQP